MARALLALGVVAVHDPGGLVPDPTTAAPTRPMRALTERGELPVRVHASHRSEALDAVHGRGLRRAPSSVPTPTGGPGWAG